MNFLAHAGNCEPRQLRFWNQRHNSHIMFPAIGRDSDDSEDLERRIYTLLGCDIRCNFVERRRRSGPVTATVVFGAARRVLLFRRARPPVPIASRRSGSGTPANANEVPGRTVRAVLVLVHAGNSPGSQFGKLKPGCWSSSGQGDRGVIPILSKNASAPQRAMSMEEVQTSPVSCRIAAL
jgi:hypothetical protein